MLSTFSVFGTAAAPKRGVGTRLGDNHNTCKIIGTRVARLSVFDLKCVAFQALTSRCFTGPSQTESRWSQSFSIADIVSALLVDTLFVGIERIDLAKSVHRIMALHDSRLAECLALGTQRQCRLQLTDIQEIIALHSLSLGIVIGHVTPSHQSLPPVPHLQLLAFFQSLFHLLTYLPLRGRRVYNGLVCQYSL